MLTIKQEKFIQNIVQGMSQREAYKSSYNAKNMKDDTIDNKACNLFKQDKIRARYEELLKKIEDKAIMTAEERQIWLSKVVKGDIKITREYDDEIKEYEPYMSDRLKAMDILNKMSGEYTQKIELENEKPFEVNIKVV
ncbi:MAG: terminase small subunit [Clostridia bacterium]